MGAARSMNTAEFDREVINGPLPAVVDFGATWCGPCQALAPHVENLAQEFAGKVLIAKVDVDDNNDLAARFGIMSVPTVMFFKGGKVVGSLVGNQPEAIRSWIGKLLAP